MGVRLDGAVVVGIAYGGEGAVVVGMNLHNCSVGYFELVQFFIGCTMVEQMQWNGSLREHFTQTSEAAEWRSNEKGSSSRRWRTMAEISSRTQLSRLSEPQGEIMTLPENQAGGASTPCDSENATVPEFFFFSGI